MKRVPIEIIPGYEVSEDGRVFSVHYNWLGKGEYELHQTPNADGYPSVRLTVLKSKRKRVAVHKLVALAFLPPRPTPNYEVRHLDGSKDNNHCSNLAWKTQKNNAEDRDRHGRTMSGEKHRSARLKIPDVIFIREQLKHGITGASLGRRFGISRNSVYAIRDQQTWKGVN